eukprot:scaffold9626_cov114-Isochrysis_galbana.AAC.5
MGGADVNANPDIGAALPAANVPYRRNRCIHRRIHRIAHSVALAPPSCLQPAAIRAGCILRPQCAWPSGLTQPAEPSGINPCPAPQEELKCTLWQPPPAYTWLVFSHSKWPCRPPGVSVNKNGVGRFCDRQPFRFPYCDSPSSPDLYLRRGYASARLRSSAIMLR